MKLDNVSNLQCLSHVCRVKSDPHYLCICATYIKGKHKFSRRVGIDGRRVREQMVGKIAEVTSASHFSLSGAPFVNEKIGHDVMGDQRKDFNLRREELPKVLQEKSLLYKQ